MWQARRIMSLAVSLPLFAGLASAQVAAPPAKPLPKPADQPKEKAKKEDQPSAKPAESKPAEVKAPKPADAKPVDAKPVDADIRVILKDSSKYLGPFKVAVELASRATVVILAEGKPVCLGLVVSVDGYIITKASELKDNVVCRLRDGRTFAPELIGIEEQNDLALLRIPAKDLPVVQWKDSKAAEVGNWVCTTSNGDEPVAVGVVSVATRDIKGRRFASPSSGFLGVTMEIDSRGPRIGSVEKDSGAAKAGLVAGDVFLEARGKKVTTPESMMDLLQSCKPGDIVKLKILRKAEGDKTEEKQLEATLGKRPTQNARGDIQNSMGGPLSQRRTAFAKILQHDTTLRPENCGGPLVDLDGKVIGINIARAGRVESWAVPSEVVRALLPDLIAGKYKVDASVTRQASLEQRLDMAKDEVKKAEEGLANARSKRAEARVEARSAQIGQDNPGGARQAKRKLDQADMELKAAQERLAKAREDLKALDESKKEKEKTEMK